MQTEAETEQPKRSGPYVEFTEEIFTDICERMAMGKGLREICSDPDMPSRSTFLRWVENDTGRQIKYQKAREACMDWYGEEVLKVAFDDSGDTLKDGERTVANHARVQRDRLKVDTLKWTMSKLHPKRWGDKLTPEAEDNRNMAISWEAPKRIERIVLEGVLPESHLRTRIAELEKQLAEARGEIPSGPPKLLTYDPGPLPKHLDPDVLVRLVDTFKRSLPQDDQREPETILDEATTVIEAALRAHYGTSEAA